MRPPFAVQSSAARSSTVSAQRIINAYPEIQPDDAKSKLVLYGTPGATLFATAGAGPIKAAISTGDAVYCVSGSAVYKISSTGTATLLGSVGIADNITIDRNRTQIVIATPPTMWVVTIATDTLAEVTDADLPNVSSVTSLDGYAIFTVESSDQWGLTAINDASDIDALDFATAESAPDELVRAFVDHREVWLFGAETTEVWYNAGGADFPFQRVSGAHLETGCAAFRSIAKMDNSVFWLGDDLKIYRAQGYQGLRVSTHAIEEEIRKAGTVSDAISFAYNQGGHAFYVFTMPTAGRCFVFDAATQLWHERDSYGLSRYRWDCAVSAFDRVLVGDSQSGGIYTLDLDIYTEASSPIRRRIIGPAVHADGSLAFAPRLEVEFEPGIGIATGQGSDPDVMMRWSEDDGATWSAEQWRKVGRQGARAARVIWNRLGSFRRRIYEVSMSDPVKFVCIAAKPTMTAAPRD